MKNKKLRLATETVRVLTATKLSHVAGGDSAEPTGSIYHNLCNSIGCPKTP